MELADRRAASPIMCAAACAAVAQFRELLGARAPLSRRDGVGPLPLPPVATTPILEESVGLAD
eukprot:1890863-Lingulodinium_polyedra.AAC.1